VYICTSGEAGCQVFGFGGFSSAEVFDEHQFAAGWIKLRVKVAPFATGPSGGWESRTPAPVRYNIYTMEFEFDPVKSEVNKNKHGIDFVDAQALWDDPDFLEIPATTTGERRSVVIGRIAGKHRPGIVTCRGDRIRIISVRRSREEEIRIYET